VSFAHCRQGEREQIREYLAVLSPAALEVRSSASSI
jgi:hypothetical protein